MLPEVRVLGPGMLEIFSNMGSKDFFICPVTDILFICEHENTSTDDVFSSRIYFRESKGYEHFLCDWSSDFHSDGVEIKRFFLPLLMSIGELRLVIHEAAGGNLSALRDDLALEALAEVGE